MTVKISREQATKMGLTVPKSATKRGMNSLERAYSERLEARRLAGEILWWGWEAVKVRLADKTWYTPDFAVLACFDVTQQFEFHETKGFMRDDANVKIKVAAELYPFTFRLVKKVKGEWTEKVIPGKRT